MRSSEIENKKTAWSAPRLEQIDLNQDTGGTIEDAMEGALGTIS